MEIGWGRLGKKSGVARGCYSQGWEGRGGEVGGGEFHLRAHLDREGGGREASNLLALKKMMLRGGGAWRRKGALGRFYRLGEAAAGAGMRRGRRAVEGTKQPGGGVGVVQWRWRCAPAMKAEQGGA